jgi:hypothetical protein
MRIIAAIGTVQFQMNQNSVAKPGINYKVAALVIKQLITTHEIHITHHNQNAFAWRL